MVRLLPTRSLHLSAASIHCSGAKELSGPTKGATEAGEGLPANHVLVVVLVTSGRCWPCAVDEEWYSLKRPSSTLANQHSSGSSDTGLSRLFSTIFINLVSAFYSGCCGENWDLRRRQHTI